LKGRGRACAFFGAEKGVWAVRSQVAESGWARRRPNVVVVEVIIAFEESTFGSRAGVVVSVFVCAFIFAFHVSVVV